MSQPGLPCMAPHPVCLTRPRGAGVRVSCCGRWKRSSGLAEKGRRGCGHSLQGSVRSLSLPSGVTAWRLSPGFSTRGDFAPRDIQSRQAPFQL